MKKIYLIIILALSTCSSLQSTDQQSVQQQQLDIAKTAFATALLVAPLTAPIAQVFSSDFIMLIKTLIANLFQQLKSRFTPTEQAAPAIKPYFDLLAKLNNAISYSNDPVIIAKNLQTQFATEGTSFFNAITEAFTKSSGGLVIRRDFKEAFGENDPLTKIAENSLWAYELQSTMNAIDAMTPAEKENLFEKFQQLSPDVSDTGKADFTQFIKTYVEPLVQDVFVDSTLTVLLFDEGVQQGLTIPLDELAEQVQANKEKFAPERAQLLENMKKIYTADRPPIVGGGDTATAQAEARQLLSDLSAGIDLKNLFQPIQNKVQSYGDIFDKLLSIAKESTNAREFQENLSKPDWGTTDAGRFFTLLSAVQSDIIDYMQNDLNISIKRSYLRVDPALSNYIKVIEAVNYAGKYAGDFGIFDALKNNVLTPITSANDKYTFMVKLLDQTNMDQIRSLITDQLQPDISDLAKNYAADQGLSMVVLEKLKSAYNAHEYSYNDVMKIVQQLKQKDPAIVDQMIKNMQRTDTFSSDRPDITSRDSFNVALAILNDNITVPTELIQNQVRIVKSQRAIEENIDTGVSTEDIKRTQEKGSTLPVAQEPDQPVDDLPGQDHDISEPIDDTPIDSEAFEGK